MRGRSGRSAPLNERQRTRYAVGVENATESRKERPSDDDVASNLMRYGAPLLGNRPGGSLGLEETLAWGVRLARRDPAIARVWPVAFAKNRRDVNVERLVSLAVALGEKRACGLLLWVTGTLMGDEALVARAERLRDERPPEPEYFFLGGGEGLHEVARRKTEEFAKRWSFWMGAPFEMFFQASYRKFMRKHA